MIGSAPPAWSTGSWRATICRGACKLHPEGKRVNQTYNRFLPLILVGGVTIAAGAAPQRPPIVGVANIALKVGDLEKARNFYGHVLGYSEAFQLKQEGDAPA